VIVSIRHKALRRFFSEDDPRGLPADQLPRLRIMLAALHAADRIEELASVPGWRLHRLKGGLRNHWSLSVSGNWRLIFEFRNGNASGLDLVDYH
jgi:proteic killer suppression protein